MASARTVPPCAFILHLMLLSVIFFFFNDTATTEIYTLSLHDALPICCGEDGPSSGRGARPARPHRRGDRTGGDPREQPRSEEHTSELQSQSNLVCRLLLEKKNIPAVHRVRSCYTPRSCVPSKTAPPHD